MPQVDLESLVSVFAGGGGAASDRKIACENVAGGDPPPDHSVLPENPPDLPPDSFWLSKDAEFDWFDRNAFYYDRKDSTKATTPTSSTNLNPNLNRSNSNSHRFSVSLKSKASIIGLPKPQKACFSDLKLRHTNKHKPTNNSLFPKRSAPEGKSRVSVREPSSPKVSCYGRVRSKKDWSLRSRNRSRGAEPVSKNEITGRKRRTTGIWTSLTRMFRSREKPPAQPFESLKESPKALSPPPRRSVATPSSVQSPAINEPAEPPTLGGLKRFASGRRSDSSWVESPVNNEPAEPPGLGGVKRFASGRRSDSSWGVVG